MPTVGVFAAVFDENGRILCVKQAYGPRRWTLPGGRMEPGESVLEALRREVWEETGYRTEPGRLIGVYSAPPRDVVVLFFEAMIIDREAWQANEEIAQVAFFGQSDLPEPMHPWQAVRVRDAFQKESCVVRVMAPVE
ncbi:MAG TPA: NUDIX domain-containing protein [Chloroflexota bacterium]|nr:NUDIX domain-containing protein [Chloroflexota bacterium]